MQQVTHTHDNGARDRASVQVQLPPQADDAVESCPLCGRRGTVVVIGDVLMCAACGYASDGVRCCT